jgi:hypothetical protein
MEVCGVPQISEEWWAYRRTYHAHVRDELVCRTFKEESLSTTIKALVGDIEERETLDRSSVGQFAEALEPFIKFIRCKVFDMLPSVNFIRC